MAQTIKHIVYPVKDLAAAKALYGKFLAVEPYVDEPYYVGYKLDDQEVGLDPNAHNLGVTSPIAYLETTNIQASLQGLVDAGAQPLQEVKDVGGGLLIATVKDADGNVLGLKQPQ